MPQSRCSHRAAIRSGEGRRHVPDRRRSRRGEARHRSPRGVTEGEHPGGVEHHEATPVRPEHHVARVGVDHDVVHRHARQVASQLRPRLPCIVTDDEPELGPHEQHVTCIRMFGDRIDHVARRERGPEPVSLASAGLPSAAPPAATSAAWHRWRREFRGTTARRAVWSGAPAVVAAPTRAEAGPMRDHRTRHVTGLVPPTGGPEGMGSVRGRAELGWRVTLARLSGREARVDGGLRARDRAPAPPRVRRCVWV